MKNYSSQDTAVLIVDPYNDFLSEGGKLWSITKETVNGVNLIGNLKNILSAARSSGFKIIYVPHHQTEKGDYVDWKSRAPSHQGSLDYSSLNEGVGAENSIQNSYLRKVILLLNTIGLPAALQIQILIFTQTTQSRSRGYCRNAGQHLH
jgi:hypothetical protein